MQEFIPDEPDGFLFDIDPADHQGIYGGDELTEDVSLPIIPDAGYPEYSQEDFREYGSLHGQVLDTREEALSIYPGDSERVVLKKNELATVETTQFPIVVAGRLNFKAEVQSSTLGTFSGVSAVVENGQRSEPQDIVYDFGESGGRRISASISLRPGENDIVFSLDDHNTGQSEEARLRVVVPGRAYGSQGVEFLLHEQSQAVDDAALDRIAVLTDLMNSYLEHPVSQIYIKDSEFPAGSATNNRVELSRFNFDNPERESDSIAWHELSHCHYGELEGEDYYFTEEDQQKPYGRMFRGLYDEAFTLSLIEGADADDKQWSSIRANSVMEVFNSELYTNSSDPSLGHPQYHAGELFAYASEILLFHADDFLQRVSMLETPEDQALALQVARAVADSYVRDGTLPEALQALENFR